MVLLGRVVDDLPQNLAPESPRKWLVQLEFGLASNICMRMYILVWLLDV